MICLSTYNEQRTRSPRTRSHLGTGELQQARLECQRPKLNATACACPSLVTKTYCSLHVYATEKSTLFNFFGSCPVKYIFIWSRVGRAAPIAGDWRWFLLRARSNIVLFYWHLACKIEFLNRYTARQMPSERFRIFKSLKQWVVERARFEVTKPGWALWCDSVLSLISY